MLKHGPGLAHGCQPYLLLRVLAQRLLQGFYSVHTVPIIENTARECELTDRLRDAIQR